jgi:hypothetical protein
MTNVVSRSTAKSATDTTLYSIAPQISRAPCTVRRETGATASFSDKLYCPLRQDALVCIWISSGSCVCIPISPAHFAAINSKRSMTGHDTRKLYI